MGERSGATNKLEQAFAAAFAAYFVGDPTYVMPPPFSGSLFVAAQSVQTLSYPSVIFMCLEAKEVAPQTANYEGTELHILTNTALTERPDDYPSLLALHNDRINKLFLLLDNTPLLQGLTNQPASGVADLRAVREFYLYGFGNISKELNMKEGNRLCSLISIEVTFRPMDS